MRAFVIKNKEGKYLQYFTDMYRFDFTDRLINAMFYEQWEQDSINYALKTIPDCDEVVEITIAEGDLEQEIRKQVCNEIRNYIDNKIYDRFDDQDVDYLTIDLEEFEDLLQDLEQAKDSMK